MESLVLFVERVSPAEQLVLDQLAQGQSNAEIAVNLYLSERTVRTHVGNLMGKLGAESRLQVVLTAQELGIVDSPDTISAPATVILALIHAFPGALDELIECGALDAPKGD